MSRAGSRLIKSAKEAAQIARGDVRPARLHVPAEIDVRSIRHQLHLSQDDFASEFGFSTTQIRDWEQGRSRPLGGNRAYLMVIKENPTVIREILKNLPTDNSDDPPNARAM